MTREPATTGLDLEGLGVRFGDRAVLRDVSLRVAPGEVLALLGPSGSGKSTLLRAIAGLEPVTGELRWDGRDIRRVPVHRREFALLFQDGQLFPHLDVAGNIGYPLRLRRVDPALRVTELLELVGLAGFARRAVAELSGGEAQRVALARALAAEPRLLLLDEPFSALDRELRERLAADVRGILERTGTTAVLVTHDHAEAERVADRVGILDAGALLQVGTLAELRAAPATSRVAEFLGAPEAAS